MSVTARPATCGETETIRLRTFVGSRPPTPCAAAGLAATQTVASASATVHTPRRSRIRPCSHPSGAGSGSGSDDAVPYEVERDERHRDGGEGAQRRAPCDHSVAIARPWPRPRRPPWPARRRLRSRRHPSVAAQAIVAATTAGPATSGMPNGKRARRTARARGRPDAGVRPGPATRGRARARAPRARPRARRRVPRCAACRATDRRQARRRRARRTRSHSPRGR